MFFLCAPTFLCTLALLFVLGRPSALYDALVCWCSGTVPLVIPTTSCSHGGFRFILLCLNFTVVDSGYAVYLAPAPGHRVDLHFVCSQLCLVILIDVILSPYLCSVVDLGVVLLIVLV